MGGWIPLRLPVTCLIYPPTHLSSPNNQKGGLFANYEWVVLPSYQSTNPEHQRIKEGIEVGNGLPTLATPEEVLAAVRAAGFEVVRLSHSFSFHPATIHSFIFSPTHPPT